MISKNRQVFYKILQMDVGTESYLGFCKSNAKSRIQNEYNGDERVGFRSSGNVGDVFYNVSVTGAQGGDVYVRIQLSVSASDSIFFGYGNNVEMRCRCKAVAIKKTPVGFPTVAVERVVGDPTSTTVLTVKDGYGEITQEIDGSTTLNANSGLLEYINTPYIYAPVTGAAVGQPEVDARGDFYVFSGSRFAGSYTSVSPTYEELVARIKPADIGRIGVFSTDGTEYKALSVETTYPKVSVILLPGGAGHAMQQVVSYTDKAGLLKKQIFYAWAGGNQAWYVERLYSYSQATVVATQETIKDFTPLFAVGELDKICYKQEQAFAITFNPVPTQVFAEELTRRWNTDQITAYERENMRRLACSNAQQLLLRSGFLPPEFEYFIRTTANKSARVKREYPLTAVSRQTTVVSGTVDPDGGDEDRTWTHKVKLKYTTQKTSTNNGVTTTTLEDKEKEFSGTLRYQLTSANATRTNIQYIIQKYTYTNFPFLADDLTGTVIPVPAAITDDPPTNLVFKETLAAGVWSDLQAEPLMVEANGVFLNNPTWRENNTYFAADYLPTPSGIPPFEKTSNNVTLTHPQFLLDYFKDSPPIEFETNSAGEKVAVTPNTDWLSSRMNDREEFKVVPLNFVQAGTPFTPTAEAYPTDTLDQLLDRCVFGALGMFPYRIENSVGTQEIDRVLVYGYAVVGYKTDGNTLTVKKWVEFTEEGKISIHLDDAVTLNDELNPTTIAVSGKTHNMKPKEIAWNIDWVQTNCVCVGDDTPWTDLKATAKTQKAEIKSATPTTPEMSLYKAVSDAIK